MAYTPTQWNTGDDVTATKLNKLENGVANAGSVKIAEVSISASGYGSASINYAYIVYARQVNNNWVVITDEDGDWPNIYGFANSPFWKIIPPQYALVSSTICPFIVYLQKDTEIVTTGDVSDTAESLYFSYGSGVVGGGYRISGDGSVTFVAT